MVAQLFHRGCVIVTNDIYLAFAHPSTRSEADDATGELYDRISLRDYVSDVEIGAFQAERGTTQRLRFNVVVELLPPPDPLDDDVDKILSYDTITEAIEQALGEERLNLLETLAERVAQRLLAEPQPLRVFVRIEKLDRGPGALGVEIVRRRGSEPAPTGEETAPAPVVVHLTNAAIADPRLKAWLDRLEQAGLPVILCVGAADLAAPKSGVPQAQRRIDLLAIEQNAWVLAGRDARCVVTSTRTELDWAMKQRQISVWAPSKIVLDAVDVPPAHPSDAVSLSRWFARLMGAQRFLAVSGDGTVDADGIEAVSCDAALSRL